MSVLRTVLLLALGATMTLAQRRLALPDPRSCSNRKYFYKMFFWFFLLEISCEKGLPWMFHKLKEHHLRIDTEIFGSDRMVSILLDIYWLLESVFCPFLPLISYMRRAKRYSKGCAILRIFEVYNLKNYLLSTTMTTFKFSSPANDLISKDVCNTYMEFALDRLL